ncbi:MAG TPA: GNAT family N-acetyltransferase [Aggregatilinea sp.]|uniref:GNAT family N-acetyltransferase n=1 Tax=Aggregatilinea sp. TaxID=2806333 RepID=UPI002CEB0E86|nr:GNAT family N-acetyltransferase [Aggregatilinea sp.]HML24082.1 GNAT family N-acetyltransferase [Aggregatilinea sp.]
MPSVGLVIEMDGGLILVKRGGSVKTGQWAFPSGYIEEDESVEEAAVRESREETGLDVELIDLLGVYSFPEGPPSSGIIVFYRARPVGGTLCAGDDAQEARVFAPDDVPDMPFRTHRQVLQRWRILLHQRQIARESNELFYIRQAEPADAPVILELLKLVDANHDLSEEECQAVMLRFAERQTISVFVAETTGTPHDTIGFVALSLMQTLTGARGWIDDMAVAVGYRGEGVGAALLEAAMRHANRLNLTHLYVNTGRGNEATRAFYQAAGFLDGAISYLRIR